MLKQFLILIISSVIILFSGIWEIKYIENSSRYLLSDVEYSKNALNNNNFDLAKEHVENMEDTWNYLKNVWNMFVIKEDVEEIDDYISSYKIHTEYDNKEESEIDCKLLENAIKDVVAKHKLKFENIF